MRFLFVSFFLGASAFPPPDQYYTFIKPHSVPESQDSSSSFKHKYVVRGGAILGRRPTRPPYITVYATSLTSDAAHFKAALIISLMTKHMPLEVFSGISRSDGVGVFSGSEKLTVFPALKSLANPPQCGTSCSGGCASSCTFDGRKLENLAAVSETISVVIDHNVMCDSQDSYHHADNLLVHEFAHQTMKYMSNAWKAKIEEAYKHAMDNRLWTSNTYATADSKEYFAEASSAFFMAINRTDSVTGGLNRCGTSLPCPSEMAARSYIKQQDPQLFACLSYAYTNGHPDIPGHLKPCI